MTQSASPPKTSTSKCSVVLRTCYIWRIQQRPRHLPAPRGANFGAQDVRRDVLHSQRKVGNVCPQLRQRPITPQLQQPHQPVVCASNALFSHGAFLFEQLPPVMAARGRRKGSCLTAAVNITEQSVWHAPEGAKPPAKSYALPPALGKKHPAMDNGAPRAPTVFGSGEKQQPREWHCASVCPFHPAKCGRRHTQPSTQAACALATYA